MPHRILSLTSLVGAFLLICGCSSGTADVTGSVTYNGKPVKTGTVTFFVDGATPKAGQISPDGTYKVAGVKIGPAKVTVASPDPSTPDPDKIKRETDPSKIKGGGGKRPTGGTGKASGDWVPLPAQYADFTKSGLSYTVQASENKYNIELK